MNNPNEDGRQADCPEFAQNPSDGTNFRPTMMQMLVQSIHHVTGKCNISYTLLIIVCITAVLALYNEYASFSQRFVKLSHLAHNEEIKRLIESSCDTVRQGADSLQTEYCILTSDISERLLDNYVQHFVDTQFFTFPIIGVTISTADVTTFLSLAVLIMTAWCYVCIRSENFATGKILNMTQEYPLQFRKYIFYSICFHNIFFPTTFRNKPYERLSDKKSGMPLSKTLANNKRKNDDYNTWFNRTTRRGSMATVLFLLPIIIAIANSVVMLYESCDLAKYVFPTNRCVVYGDNVLIYSDTPEKYTGQYTDKHKKFVSLSKPYRMDADSKIYQKTEPLIKYVTAIRWVTALSLLLSLLIFHFCIHCIKYLKRTNDIMFSYKSAIKCEEEFETLYQKLHKKGEEKEIVRAHIIQLKDPVYILPDNMIFGFTVFAPNSISELIDNIKNLEIGEEDKALRINLRKRIIDAIDAGNIFKSVQDLHNEWYCIIFDTKQISAPDDGIAPATQVANSNL